MAAAPGQIEKQFGKGLIMRLGDGAAAMMEIDSLAALTPKAEIEGDMDDSHMGLHFIERPLAA